MSHYTMMKVTEILKTVESSVDFDYVSTYSGETMDEKRTNFWIDVIRVKSADTGFGHLVNSIIENGFTSAIGWDETENQITEGHHRLVAAILLGLDEIPTSCWGDNDHGGISAHRSDDEFPIYVEV